ncbi:adenosine-deaminase domain-containing protein [Diplocarpon rosae]|nr:adenosine-deaminase domain-containing protein [Diplocarpon rosae]
MNISGDEVAEVVLREFDKWPAKRRPLVRSDGVKEWVPLSGIVAQVGMGSLECLAAATGMKCLPQSKIGQAQGVVLHDWHAEILAIRSFNRFLLEECHALASSENNVSEYIRLRNPDERTEVHFQPFALKEGITFHLYCSEAPCGDASMELTMAAQQDSTPWDLPSTRTSNSLLATESTALHGRGYFSALGAVRRKPSRPDAPPTLSKSCSDKIALKQSTSLLSSITSLLISPSNAYIHSLILPSSQYSSVACTRAFSDSGRLSILKDKEWSGGYAFQPFKIITTEKEFRYSRRQHLQVGEKLVPSNIASSWTPNHSDTLIGGGIQGRKQFSLKGASRVCKRRKWKLALEIAQMASVQAPKLERALRNKSYASVKESGLLNERREVKKYVRSSALRGWVRNEGGEDWGVEGVEI